MATVYVGYGFSADDISDASLRGFVQKHDPWAWKDFDENTGGTAEPGALKDWLEEGPVPSSCLYLSEYICKTINGREGLELLSSYESSVVFEPMDFLDSCRTRAERVPNIGAFWALIGKYLKTEELDGQFIWEEA